MDRDVHGLVAGNGCTETYKLYTALHSKLHHSCRSHYSNGEDACVEQSADLGRDGLERCGPEGEHTHGVEKHGVEPDRQEFHYDSYYSVSLFLHPPRRRTRIFDVMVYISFNSLHIEGEDTYFFRLGRCTSRLGGRARPRS